MVECVNRRAAGPQSKLGIPPAKTPRPQRSEKMNRMVCEIINLSIPNLAYFAPWRESIPVLEHSRSPENLRKLRKILCIAVQGTQSSFRRVRFAHRLVSECLAQRTKNMNSEDLPQRRQGAKVTGRGPSSRANARDLRKISPGACPELCRRGRNDIASELSVFAPWREIIRIEVRFRHRPMS